MSNNAMTDQKNLLDVLEKAVQERNELLSMIDRSNDMCALSDAYSYFYAHMNTAMKTMHPSEILNVINDPSDTSPLHRTAMELVKTAANYNVSVNFEQIIQQNQYIEDISYWSTSSMYC